MNTPCCSQYPRKKPFTMLAVLVLILVALLHLLRLVYGWTATLNGATIPLWLSAPAAIVAALLAVLVWREARA